MTINEIFNGKTSEFPGLIKLIDIYMDTIDIKEPVRNGVTKYLQFISKRASGELMTDAAYIRKFVVNHPDYKQDSKINNKINFDLMEACVKIGRGDLIPTDLLSNFTK